LVIAQIAVPDTTTDVTPIEQLLGPVDLDAKVVTADAVTSLDATQADLAQCVIAGPEAISEEQGRTASGGRLRVVPLAFEGSSNVSRLRPEMDGSMGEIMCRNIRVLHNFAPPTTEEEIQAAALQYVRKVSGSSRPSAANAAAFEAAVDQVAAATRTLLESLVTAAPPRDREVEAAKARARAAQRYGERPATSAGAAGSGPSG
jgi:hypothetical protein